MATPAAGLFWGRGGGGDGGGGTGKPAAADGDALSPLLPPARGHARALLTTESPATASPTGTAAATAACIDGTEGIQHLLPTSVCFGRVLGAIAACIREQLTQPLLGADPLPFALPAPHRLAGPFPASITSADAPYFEAAVLRDELKSVLAAADSRDITAGSRAAHTATDENVRYVFDRRGPCTTSSSTRAGGGGSGTSHASTAQDGVGAALRWIDQQSLAAAQRRKRCEHLLSLLSREIASEKERDGRLRLAVSRFLACHADREAVALNAGVDARHGMQTMRRARAEAGEAASAASRAQGVGKGTAAMLATANAQLARSAFIGGWKGVEEADDTDAPRASGSAQPKPRATPRPSLSRCTLTRKGAGSRHGESASGGGASLSTALTKCGEIDDGEFCLTDLLREAFAVVRERAEAADGLMRVAEEYRFVTAGTVATYLRDTLEEVEAQRRALVAHAPSDELSDDGRGLGEGVGGEAGSAASERLSMFSSAASSGISHGAPAAVAAGPRRPRDQATDGLPGGGAAARVSDHPPPVTWTHGRVLTEEDVPGKDFRPGIDRFNFSMSSRPQWQEQLLCPVDTSGISESTVLLLDCLKSRPEEPSDGRYSHLVGRHVAWTAANDGALHLPVEQTDWRSVEMDEALTAAAGTLAAEAAAAVQRSRAATMSISVATPSPSEGRSR